MGDLGLEGVPKDAADYKAPVNGTPGVDSLTRGSSAPARRPGLGLKIAGVVAGLATLFGTDKATGSHVENAVTDTASTAVHAVEQFVGNDPKIEHVVKENVQFDIIDGIKDNGLFKPVVIRTSPRADTIDNELDPEEAQKFGRTRVQGNLIQGGAWYHGAGEEQSQWVHFQKFDKDGKAKDLYVALTFAKEIQEQAK